MSEEELKEWFWNKYNSCYYVRHDDYPESIFMYYDVNFIRKTKFRILQGKKIVYPKKPTGVCLFKLDYKNGWLVCDNKHIWSFFGLNYMNNYIEIRKLVGSWLEEESKLKVLTPIWGGGLLAQWLEEESKLKVLTQPTSSIIAIVALEEESKLKVLTPIRLDEPVYTQLEEDTKLKVL